MTSLEVPHDAVLDTIPEDQPSHEWMSRNISLQRWWDVMTLRTTRSSEGGSSTGGGNGGATSVSIPSNEAELVEGQVERGENIADSTLPSSGTAIAAAAASQREGSSQCCGRRANVSVAFIALVIAVMVGAAVGIFFIVDATKAQDGELADSNTGMDYPTSDIPTAPVYDEGFQTDKDKVEIEALVMSMSGDSILNNSASPQSMALKWLLDEDQAQVSIRVHGEERVKQRYALSVLYFAMEGKSWNVNEYLISNHECHWTGVACNDAQLDTVLNLSSVALKGSIPPEIGELSLLEQIVLPNNTITGEIPSRIFSLPFLYVIDLNQNQMIGSLSKHVWDLPFLEHLYLNSNNLNGSIPDLPDAAPPLKHIWLHGNSLTGRIPSSLSNLVDLETFVAFDNKFNSALQLEWSALSKLFYVDVSWNQLSGPFPTGMEGASSLEFIYLNNNSMTGPLDENLGELRHLKELWLHSNVFTGEIPTRWSEMTSVSTLLLHDNELSGTVSEAFCNLTRVGQLTVLETDCKDSLICECCTVCH